MKIIRQGDVLLVAKQLPKAAKLATPDHATDVILAYGEVTGHAHRLRDAYTTGKAKLWDAGAERYLQVLEIVSLTHEEHSTATIPPGIYLIPTQVDVTTSKQVRRVAD